MPPKDKAARLAAWKAKKATLDVAISQANPTTDNAALKDAITTMNKPKPPTKPKPKPKPKPAGPIKITLSTSHTLKLKPKLKLSKKRKAPPADSFDSDNEAPTNLSKSGKTMRELVTFNSDSDDDNDSDKMDISEENLSKNKAVTDDLDLFMNTLEAGNAATPFTVDTSSSSFVPKSSSTNSNSNSNPLTTTTTKIPTTFTTTNSEDGSYTPRDWESDAGSVNDEDEEAARNEFMDALRREQDRLAGNSGKSDLTTANVQSLPSDGKLDTSKAIHGEKTRIAQRKVQLALENAIAVNERSNADKTEVGRIFNDSGDVMEEAERISTLVSMGGDALKVVAQLNKSKELKTVDHTQIKYGPINKNLYLVPKSLSSLTPKEIQDTRTELNVKVRGKGCPAPVTTFAESGLNPRVMDILNVQKITAPFPIQRQCLPALCAGRDVIGIAKTGSGKTLAYALPMLRHILAQPDLAVGESGPIGLVLAPARELAIQINDVVKKFAKNLNLRVTSVYGGAGIAEQLADIKRGCEIIVATPGRLIDILTMRGGKVMSLSRVSYVVMDEADRMFDMGFAPQIQSVLAAVRPDRQICLFSATFPMSVESLARKTLQYPIEVLVGGRSVASDTIKQYAEVLNEENKFFRLLQLLGEFIEKGKVLVFVDKQSRADQLFENLTKTGYACLTLHGGKEQEERDETIEEFRDEESLFKVLVATSVAGRGLDVPSCRLVVNFSSPNHLEDYVHRVGRTGRAGKKGTAYTFLNEEDEAAYAPIVLRALTDSKQKIPTPLADLSAKFLKKVEAGEARKAGNGFSGKGFSFESSEKSEKQQLQMIERRQALIEVGATVEDEGTNKLLDDMINKKNAAEVKELLKKERDAQRAIEKAKEKTKAVVDVVPGGGVVVNGQVINLPGLGYPVAGAAAAEPSKRSITYTDNCDLPEDGEIRDPTKFTTQNGQTHWAVDVIINDYPQQARWVITKRATVAGLQENFRTSITNKGQYYPPGVQPQKGQERKMFLALEAQVELDLRNCYAECLRLLNETTLGSANRR